MEIKTFKDHESLSAAVAAEILATLKNKPGAVICLASGETPRRTCQLLVELARRDKTDISQFTFIGLDEWVGIPPENAGSCHYFFQHELLDPLKIPNQQVHLFDGMSEDLREECTKMDAVIGEKGGIDLIVVGIGMNGHIGFNEPGVSFDNYSHVIDLDETTITVGQKYFTTPVSLQKGITLGLKHLLNAKKAILIANGTKKAGVIRDTVEQKVNNNFPATVMQQHANGFVMIDEGAASLLNQSK
jgi:galactosamine-6-phosphate isomerase